MLPLLMTLLPRVWVQFSMAVLLLPASLLALPCEQLRSLEVPGMTVTLAQHVEAGLFRPAVAGSAPFRNLPAFCRVAATLRPTSDSEIRAEIWLPEPSGWNGKYEAAGNGGWGGSLNYGDMAAALLRRYASSSTDTGHTGGRASFAMGHPEKLIDFGYRSIHEMTVAAKAVITAFYGKQPALSYFAGCSSGGRQALMEAQRFPDDYGRFCWGVQGCVAAESRHSRPVARSLSRLR